MISLILGALGSVGGLIFSFVARNWVAQLALALMVGYGVLKGYGLVKYNTGWKDGRTELSQDLNEQAAEEAKEVEQAQEAANAPGSVERLKKHWCVDCK